MTEVPTVTGKDGNITGGDRATSAFVKAKKWGWMLSTSFYRTDRSCGLAPGSHQARICLHNERPGWGAMRGQEMALRPSGRAAATHSGKTVGGLRKDPE